MSSSGGREEGEEGGCRSREKDEGFDGILAVESASFKVERVRGEVSHYSSLLEYHSLEERVHWVGGGGWGGGEGWEGGWGMGGGGGGWEGWGGGD